MKIKHKISNGYSSSFSAQERKDFQKGRWRTDCLNVEVRQRSSESPLIYSGPGHIFQDENHQLILKIYVVNFQNDTSGKGLRRTWSVLGNSGAEAGDLVPEDHYFDVMALDQEGRLWKCERVSISDADSHASTGMILELDVRHLTCESEEPSEHGSEPKAETYAIYLTVFYDLKFPRNSLTEWEERVEDEIRRQQSSINAWQFEAAGCDIELIKREDLDNCVEISVHSPFVHLPDDFQNRVTDALFFVLGKPIYPSISTRQKGKIHQRTIYSRTLPFPSASHQPPIHIAPNANWGEGESERTPYQDLADKYLRFVLVHEKPRYVWAQLHAVYEASAANFIDAQALTLSVIVEGFVNNEFEHFGQPSAELRQVVKEAQSYISAHPTWEKEHKDRFKGAIGTLKRPRIGDRLRILAEQGLIDSTAPKQWTDIRNGTAHAYQAGSMEDSYFRQCLDTLEVLFYHVFFAAIGYQGPFTDYSKRGYPMRAYPLLKKQEV